MRNTFFLRPVVHYNHVVVCDDGGCYLVEDGCIELSADSLGHFKLHGRLHVGVVVEEVVDVLLYEFCIFPCVCTLGPLFV